MSVEIEVTGMRFHGRHGVHEHEREHGQWFCVDVALDVGEEPPTRDGIDETVDYREIAACVRGVVEDRTYYLLETLGAAVADALLDAFPAARRATVGLTKPELRLEGGGVPRVSVERSR